MKRPLSLIVLAAALVAGCATPEGHRGTLGMQDFAWIAPGKTTMKEVRDRLGAPAHVASTTFKKQVYWEYLLTDAMQVDHFYSVHFAPDGVVRETGMIRHPKYDHPGGFN
jgi:hypothetical protein